MISVLIHNLTFILISSVIITNAYVNKQIFIIIDVTCENIVIIDNVDVNKLIGNFIFNLKRKDNPHSLIYNNKHFVKF